MYMHIADKPMGEHTLTSELIHGLSGHWRTVSTEVEFLHVGQ